MRQELAREGIDARLTVLGMRDNHDHGCPHPEIELRIIDGRYMLSSAGYWRTLGELDCVIDIGAGDSFAEIYGPKRFAYLWATKAMAIARGVPLLLAPQTIGPFEKAAYAKLAGWAMRRARAVVARDRPSFAAAQRLAPGAKVILATDVAFELPYEKATRQAAGPIG